MDRPIGRFKRCYRLRPGGVNRCVLLRSRLNLIVVHSSAISMLEVKQLTKNYGKLVAVTGVSFRADRGETIGLLGPNGAGKTTTVSMIAGLLSPDSGEVLIEGKQGKRETDPVKLKIGLVPQDMALYDKLSAPDTL